MQEACPQPCVTLHVSHANSWHTPPSSHPNVVPSHFANLSAERPIILLADYAWDAQGGGAVIIKSLVGDAIGNGILWVTPGRSEHRPDLGWIGLRQRPHAHFSSILRARSLAREVLALARTQNARGLWGILHGATVSITAELTRCSDLPVHVSVHDDPVYATAIRSRQMVGLAPLLARDFRRCIRAARSIDVVGTAMAERYRRKFGVTSQVVHRALDAVVTPAPPYDLAAHGLRIGLLGNTYAYSQLPVLAKAIELAAGRLGVPGSIVVCGAGFGERLRREVAGRVNVEVLGHVDEPSAIGVLQQCLALYLNYPFGPTTTVLRETSFPTKLSTYIYAARPLLTHAPHGSSTIDLCRGYSFDWTSMSPDDGAAMLLQIAAAPNAEYQAGAEEVRTRFYPAERNRRTMETCIRQLVGYDAEF